MGSNLGSQGDSRERRFINKELTANSESGTKRIFIEQITGPTYIVVIDMNFKLLYL